MTFYSKSDPNLQVQAKYVGIGHASVELNSYALKVSQDRMEVMTRDGTTLPLQELLVSDLYTVSFVLCRFGRKLARLGREITYSPSTNKNDVPQHSLQSESKNEPGKYGCRKD